jgi:hypothetical protein
MHGEEGLDCVRTRRRQDSVADVEMYIADTGSSKPECVRRCSSVLDRWTKAVSWSYGVLPWTRSDDACLPGLGSGSGGLWTPTASRGVLDASRSRPPGQLYTSYSINAFNMAEVPIGMLSRLLCPASAMR